MLSKYILSPGTTNHFEHLTCNYSADVFVIINNKQRARSKHVN